MTDYGLYHRSLQQGSFVVEADRDVLFIPTLGMVSPGYYIRSGMLLGKLCSGKKIVRAYADDRQIKALKKEK